MDHSAVESWVLQSHQSWTIDLPHHHFSLMFSHANQVRISVLFFIPLLLFLLMLSSLPDVIKELNTWWFGGLMNLMAAVSSSFAITAWVYGFGKPTKALWALNLDSFSGQCEAERSSKNPPVTYWWHGFSHWFVMQNYYPQGFMTRWILLLGKSVYFIGTDVIFSFPLPVGPRDGPDRSGRRISSVAKSFPLTFPKNVLASFTEPLKMPKSCPKVIFHRSMEYLCVKL